MQHGSMSVSRFGLYCILRITYQITKGQSILNVQEDKTPTDIVPGTKVYELVEKLVKYLPEK